MQKPKLSLFITSQGILHVKLERWTWLPAYGALCGFQISSEFLFHIQLSSRDMREAQEESNHFTGCLGLEEMPCRRYRDADCTSVSLFIFSSSLRLLPNEQAETLSKHEANPVTPSPKPTTASHHP